MKTITVDMHDGGAFNAFEFLKSIGQEGRKILIGAILANHGNEIQPYLLNENDLERIIKKVVGETLKCNDKREDIQVSFRYEYLESEFNAFPIKGDKDKYWISPIGMLKDIQEEGRDVIREILLLNYNDETEEYIKSYGYLKTEE